MAGLPARTGRILSGLDGWRLKDDEWSQVGDLLTAFDVAMEHNNVTVARQTVIGLVRWSNLRLKREISPTMAESDQGPIPDTIRDVRDKLLHRIGYDVWTRRDAIDDRDNSDQEGPDEVEGRRADL